LGWVARPFMEHAHTAWFIDASLTPGCALYYRTATWLLLSTNCCASNARLTANAVFAAHQCNPQYSWQKPPSACWGFVKLNHCLHSFRKRLVGSAVLWGFCLVYVVYVFVAEALPTARLAAAVGAWMCCAV
jgi:hypothetical protein